ncbi:unnamed protein product [Enterobius vermicularis]|uniref:Uncharacterized protein n=1 Tax=Enterobius vermicularis TaxID=51028 RepID=A0A0N4VLV0_ENTVE|nr:unnamed protein product [Enterobius vermicularis]
MAGMTLGTEKFELGCLQTLGQGNAMVKVDGHLLGNAAVPHFLILTWKNFDDYAGCYKQVSFKQLNSAN